MQTIYSNLEFRNTFFDDGRVLFSATHNNFDVWVHEGFLTTANNSRVPAFQVIVYPNVDGEEDGVFELYVASDNSKSDELRRWKKLNTANLNKEEVVNWAICRAFEWSEDVSALLAHIYQHGKESGRIDGRVEVQAEMRKLIGS